MMSVLMVLLKNVNMSLIVRADNLENNHQIYYTAESDILTKVINNAEKTKQRRRIRVTRRRRRDTIYIAITTSVMILIASFTVIIRMIIIDLPQNSSQATGPPHTPSPEYQYVVDWNMDFPDAKASERQIPVLISSLKSNLLK